MQDQSLLQFDVFRMDLTDERLWCNDKHVRLTPKAFAMLRCLAERSGQLVTKAELLDSVWPDTTVSESVLTNCMRELRRALGDQARAPEFIETVHRRGYRFIAAVTAHTVTPQVAPAQLTAAFEVPSRIEESSAETGLIEREAALVVLQRGLSTANQGKRQLILVSGEPGIGKTALVRRFMEQCTTVTPWLGYAQCVEHFGAGEPYMPVLEALGRLCRSPQGEHLVALLRQRAPTWLAQMPWLFSPNEQDSLQRTLLNSTQPRMLREMAEVVEALTTQAPLILVLEDLHWSDYASIDLISMLAQRQEPARFLLLGTYRPAEVMTSDHPLKGMKQALQLHGRCEEMKLELLSFDGVATYLQSLLTQHDLPEAFTRLIFERTEGNPFFLVTLIDQLIGQDVLLQHQGHWTLRDEVDSIDIGVPENLRQMILLQYEALAPDEQRVLEMASVMGAEFTIGVMAAGLGLSAVAAEALCVQLVRRQEMIQQAVVKAGIVHADTTGYAFRHWFYRHTIYGHLGSERRVQLHRQIGAVLEDFYGEQVGVMAAELALHLERAREFQRASDYLHRAGKNARRQHAYEEAAGHFAAGLNLLTTVPETQNRMALELQLQTALASTLIATQGYAVEEVERAYERARELCEDIADECYLLSIIFGQRGMYLFQAQLTSALKYATEGLQIAQHLNTPEALLRAYQGLGTVLFWRGELIQAQVHLEVGIAIYEAQPRHEQDMLYGQDPGMMCLCYDALLRWALGNADQALQKSEAVLSLAYRIDHPLNLVFVLNCAATLHQYRAEPACVQSYAESALSISSEHGFPFMSHWSLVMRGWAMAMQGQVDAGIAQMLQGIEMDRATGERLSEMWFCCLLAEAYREAGQPKSGFQLLDARLSGEHGHQTQFYMAEAYRLRGECLLHVSADDAVQAEADFRTALDIAQRQQAQSWALRAMMSLARLWHQQGKSRQAYPMLKRIYTGFTEGFKTPALQAAQVLLAELENA